MFNQRFIAPRLLLFFLILAPRPASSHPMGNFSISHYAAIQVEPNAIEVRYIVDMAEIPTFQEMQQTGMTPSEGDRSLNVYLVQKAGTLKNGLTVEVNGLPLRLQTVSRSVIFPPGAGGLSTMKMGFVYRAALKTGPSESVMHLHFQDNNFPDHAGWKEIVARAAQGITFSNSSVPENDRSARLTNYPTDMLNSPPQQFEADISFTRDPPLSAHLPPITSRAQAPPSAPLPAIQTPITIPLQANKQGTPRNAFTELIGKKEWGFWFLLTAALIAAGLGAFHALEPGHGKTIVAAYLVGSQGTAMHACLLGLIVTASHTTGVYLLGALTLYASRYFVPEQLYPWLSVGSGLIIMGLGIYLVVQRYKGKEHHHSHTHHHGHSHVHDQAHPHEHHDHAHAHPHSHEHHHHDLPAKVSYRQLLALGVTGGIIPCPAALVVLLSAVALHRIAFGLFLILAFSIGLAAVLIAIGLLMVYARRFMSRLKGEGPLITRWLPLASAAFITFLGFAITFRALTTVGIRPRAPFTSANVQERK